MPPLLSRVITGLIVGVIIAAVIAIALILPAVVIFRLVTGYWPGPPAWTWLGTILAGQIVAVTIKTVLTTRKGTPSGRIVRDENQGAPPAPPPP